MKDRLIRLGYAQPELRKHLRPILDSITKEASWGYQRMHYNVGGLFFPNQREAEKHSREALRVIQRFFSGARMDIDLTDDGVQVLEIRIQEILDPCQEEALSSILEKYENGPDRLFLYTEVLPEFERDGETLIRLELGYFDAEPM